MIYFSTMQAIFEHGTNFSRLGSDILLSTCPNLQQLSPGPELIFTSLAWLSIPYNIDHDWTIIGTLAAFGFKRQKCRC